MTYEEMKKNLPKFNSLEEVRAYANKTLYTREPQQQAPTVLKVVTPKQPTTPQIGAGDTTQLPKDYDMKEHMGALSADKYVGELQLEYNDAMNEYYKSQSTADLEKAQGILKEIEEFQKKNPNDNTAGWLSQVAQHFPQFIEQQKAGIKGAVVGAGAGFGVGAGIGTVVPGAGTLTGGVAGAGYGGKTGYVAGIAKWSYDQMRGSAYASLLELGARSGLTVEEQKYFNEVAREIASDTAFWQSVVESGEAVLDLATMGGFSKLFTTGAKTATQMTVKKMLAEALKAYGINILSEGAEEGAQERIAIEKEKEYLKKIGKEYTGTKEEESARVKEAVEGGMIVSTVYGGANAVGSVVLNTINNQNATQSTVSQQPNLPKDWKPSKQVATQSTNTEMTKLNTQMTELKNTAESAENVQTSIDSKGRELSEVQQEKFNNSKIRDEKGRLLVVYHGTSNEITSFDTENNNYTQYGNGAYFTNEIGIAEEFANERTLENGKKPIIMETYLDITKPFDNTASLKNTPERAKLLEILREKGLNERQLNNIVDANIDYPFELIQRYIGKGEKGNWETSVEVNNIIREAGYDGIIANYLDGKQYVAFKSNQIKDVANTKPTMSNDIRYDKQRNVDIKQKTKYNAVTRKEGYKPGEIHASFNFSDAERNQIRSEVWNFKKKETDGLHYIDLSAKGFASYIYKKQGDEITPIVKLEGHEEILNFVRRRVEDGKYKEYGTARRWSSTIRSEYGNNNGRISDVQHGRKKDTNDVVASGQNRQQPKGERRTNIGESKNDLTKNSEKGSNFLSKNDERYDAMPMTAQEKLEKWADNRQQVYKDLAEEFGKGAMFWEANMDYYTQEQAINFVSREWNVVKKFAEQNNIEIEETYNFEKRIRESKEFQEYIKNIVAPLYAEKPKLTSEELTELAQDEFGTTNDFTFGAFMTPDGKMLDFEEDGYRNDHNGIRSINYNVDEFVSAGNIRIKPEGNGFELSVEPTSEQYETLAKYIDDYLQGQNIFVDITNEKGSPIAGRSYAENTPSSKIFNDIKEYFRTGKYPEKSELDDFRYDMMPTLKDGFYSQLESTIINKMQRQAKASDVMNLILKNGVKQDEIAWTGIDDFLAGRDTITKEEVLEYIRASQLEVEEVVYEDDLEAFKKELENRISDYEYQVEQIESKMEDILTKYGIPLNTLRYIYDDEEELYGKIADFVNFTEDGDVITTDGDEVSEYQFMQDLAEYVRLEFEKDDYQGSIDAYYDGDEDFFGLNEYRSTRFEDYATKWRGGTNYREVLYISPSSTYTKMLAEYESPHWYDKNVLAHTRLQDYEDDGGAKVLFVEEIQSDMHQKGRKYGYKEKYEDLDTKISDLQDEALHLEDILLKESNRKKRIIESKYNATGKELAEILNKHYIRREELRLEIIRPLEMKTDSNQSSAYSSSVIIDMKYLNDNDIQLTRESMGLSQEELEKIVSLNNELTKMLLESKEISFEKERITENSEELQKLYSDIEALQLKKRHNHEKIDSRFPFKKNWHEFVIRKVINEAVQQGYDKVAWTTGKQQNDRYNLANYITQIKYFKNEDGTYDIHASGDESLDFKNQTVEQLEELLGKDITNKILQKRGFAPNYREGEKEWWVLSGLELELGEEEQKGMKGFYDKIIPEYLNKYLKKWNSKVEEVLIPDFGGEVHVQQGFAITPEMREAVKATGQPLYDSEIDSMSRKNIINKITETFGVERFANSNKELNEIASNIKNRIKARTITVKEMRDIVRDLGERLQVTTDKYNGQYDALKDELRTTKIYVSDSVKNGFGDWNDFRKSNFGTLKLTNDSKAVNVGEMYTYLQDKYGEDMFPGNITNESDQLEKIADVASDIKKYNISIEEYSRNMYGAEGWAEIQQMLVDEIKAIRTEYDLENPIDRSKQARVADKKTKEILKSIGITEEEIYDPANAFVQNLLETIEKDKEYFSRTLHEIEEGNLIFGDKRTNNILNKRRYDVQNGIVKANPKYSEGASLSAMRKEIENYLGRKIGLGGFRQRAYGIYKPSLDTIRIKDISNMETAIHELGHRVDYKELKSSLKGRSAKELDKLAERAFATMYDKQEDRKLEEGWAEFTKRFVVDNQTTLKEYPELSAYMLEELEKNKNMKKVIENLVELAEQYVNAPTEKQIRKMQSIGENTDKRTERNLFDKFMYEVYDDLWDIKQMTREFAKGKKQTFWTINPEDNIYNLMRTLRANEDRVLNVMKYGLIDDAGFKRTRGMSEIVEKLGDNPEKIQKVRDLMVALRTLDYTAVKLDTGLSTEEALKLIANYSKEKDILDTANGIMQFQEEIMKYAVEKGLMKKDDYEEMKKWNKFYIPLKRVYDGKVNSSTGGKGASKLTKQRTGSMRDIIDPLESIIQNTSMILTKINQNEIMKTLARLQEQTGIADYFEIVPPPQKLKAEVDLNLFKTILEEQGVDTDELDLDVVQKIFNPVMNDDAKMIMGYMDNGVLKAMEFKDRNIYDVLSKTSSSPNWGIFIETLEKFTGALRMGATTSNIEFALPNVISDTMTAWMFSESGFAPFVDSLKGVYDYMLAEYSWFDKISKDSNYKQENKYLYDLYKQSGATMATRVASYRPEVQEYVLEVFGKHANDLFSENANKSRKAGKAIMDAIMKSPQKLQDVLSIIPELSEQGTRFESFKKDYKYFRKQGHNHKNALLKASANTRDITMDFNRMGRGMRHYNRLRAFSGARAQGLYRFIEGIEKAPKQVTTKLGIMVGISLAILAMAKSSGNKKEEEVTDQVRKDNFIIPLGKDGEILTIKKPQGAVRSVINFAEMLYNVATGETKEEDYDKVWANWVKDTVSENSPIELNLGEGSDISSIFATSVLPNALEPLVENALNKDFYYGNQIVPYGKENLRLEDQYDENTSQTAILLGKVLKQSPAKIENLITGWFAGVGQQALNISDTMLGQISDEIPEQPEKNKNEQMVLRRFFANSYKNSNSVSEVYELIEKLEQLNAYDELSFEEEQKLKKLNNAKETMQDLNKEIRSTRNSLKLNAEQKREKINELQTLRTDTARYYLGKELINPSNADKIELYEYYPDSTTYKYKVNSMKTVEVEFTEADQKEYAQIARDEYNKLLSTEEKKRSYKEKNEEEKLETRESLLTKAKNTAKDIVAEKVYKRSR